jgi:CubicO group peptidase (beta-lactamase class C family)
MDAALDRAVRLVRVRKAAAQLVVVREGRVLVDEAFGCTPDSLFLIYSASKPFVALLVHLLAERGLLSLDDRVAHHWPEYAQSGKEAITVRHVLQHRSGVPVSGNLLLTLVHLCDWEASVHDAERARPRWPAGEVPAYQFMNYGFILGELVRRVTGTPVRDFMAAELLAPVGLDDIHLGLPDAMWSRHVAVRAGAPSELMNQILSNRRRVWEAVIPSASVSATARQLGRFYQMLLNGGELDGARVLAPETIAEARRLSSDGEVDRFIRHPVRWAQGFQLGGPGADPSDLARVMGSHSSREAFGHAGNVSCVAWADPGRQLVLVYLTNVQPPLGEGIRHLGEVSDAVLAACE